MRMHDGRYDLASPGLAGRQEMFTAAMMMYAAANACIGATPAAYAADVMPQSVSGFGLGIYRCAGDIGKLATHPMNATRGLCTYGNGLHMPGFHWHIYMANAHLCWRWVS